MSYDQIETAPEYIRPGAEVVAIRGDEHTPGAVVRREIVKVNAKTFTVADVTQSTAAGKRPIQFRVRHDDTEFPVFHAQGDGKAIVVRVGDPRIETALANLERRRIVRRMETAVHTWTMLDRRRSSHYDRDSRPSYEEVAAAAEELSAASLAMAALVRREERPNV